MTPNLTTRQREIRDLKRKGLTVREIADVKGVTTQHVYRVLHRLKALGAIK